jgi:hypothetical protein
MLDPISKITRAKRPGMWFKQVECLPSKFKALSLNPIATTTTTTTKPGQASTVALRGDSDWEGTHLDGERAGAALCTRLCKNTSSCPACSTYVISQKCDQARYQWLMPAIPATWEAEQSGGSQFGPV